MVFDDFFKDIFFDDEDSDDEDSEDNEDQVYRKITKEAIKRQEEEEIPYWAVEDTLKLIQMEYQQRQDIKEKIDFDNFIRRFSNLENLGLFLDKYQINSWEELQSHMEDLYNSKEFSEELIWMIQRELNYYENWKDFPY